MKQPTIDQILAENDEQQLNEWMALAQGFEKVKSGNEVESELWKETFYDEDGNETGYQTFRYLPTSSAQLGKSQCLDLIVKYELEPTFDRGKVRVLFYKGGEYKNSGDYQIKDMQTAIVKASLCSAVSE